MGKSALLRIYRLGMIDLFEQLQSHLAGWSLSPKQLLEESGPAETGDLAGLLLRGEALRKHST